MAVALSVSTAATAEDAPLVLEPSSAWHLDYRDDSCRLARTFGEGVNRTVLWLDRFEPTDAVFLSVASGQLEPSYARPPTLAFGPNGFERIARGYSGSIAAFGPALFEASMKLVDDGQPDDEISEGGRFDPTKYSDRTDIYARSTTSDQERGIEWFEIRSRGEPTVRLAIGAMDAPLNALRSCVEELTTHWGIDLEAHRKLSRGATPRRNPGEWIRTGDYPSDLWQRGAQAVVHFRLSLDNEGLPTACKVQQATGPEAFGELVCSLLMRRARFHPALDASGKSIASYWSETVSFKMPN